jgi:hypothetical protein
MRQVILDSEGRVWIDNLSKLKRDVGVFWVVGDEWLIDYVCRNMGMIAITRLGRSITVKANAALVPPNVVEVLGHYVNDGLIQVIDPREPKALKVVRGLAGVLGWLGLGATSNATCSRCFSTTAIELSRLEGIDRLELDCTARKFDGFDRWSYDYLGAGWRTTVWRRCPASGRVFMSERGPGFPDTWAHWLERGRGLPINEYADRGYGAFILEHYRAAWDAWLPTAQLVDAVVCYPGEEPDHVVYERILQPVLLGGDEPGILALARQLL